MRVLLAIDGSAHSDVAVAEVAARLWPKGTSVRVLTVVHAAAPLIPDPAFVIAAIHVEQTKEQLRHAPKIVAAAGRRIRRRSPEVSMSTRIREGVPKDVIVEEAREWDADPDRPRISWVRPCEAPGAQVGRGSRGRVCPVFRSGGAINARGSPGRVRRVV